jgi:hypothetical protein
MDLKIFDSKVWQKICDDEALSADSWIRENPRPSGPAGNCLCQWCSATRSYVERSQAIHGRFDKATYFAVISIWGLMAVRGGHNGSAE